MSDYESWISAKEAQIDSEPEQAGPASAELLQYSSTNRVVSPRLARVCLAWLTAYEHIRARYPEDGDKWDWMAGIPAELEQYYLTLNAPWGARPSFVRVAIAERQAQRQQGVVTLGSSVTPKE